jgi:hypothetical protein
MLAQNEHPRDGVLYDLVATLAASATDVLRAKGVTLTPETEHDAPGPTSFVYLTSDGDDFLLVYHPLAPVPGVDVLAPVPDPAALDRLLGNLGAEASLVTWRSEGLA